LPSVARMKNITITLDDETARWLREYAAGKALSVSRAVGVLLRQRMTDAERYELAMRQFFAVKPRPLGQPGEGYGKREDLYDRSRFR